MKKFSLASVLLSSVAFASAAFAADPLPPVVVAPEVVPPPPVTTAAGYVDAHFGFRSLFERFVVEEETEFEGDWRETVLGGAGRGAFHLSPTLVLQLDAWANFFQRRFDDGETSNWATGGVGTHLVFQTPGGLRAGALLSYGREDGAWVNAAGEVAQSFGNFRVSGQAGVAFGVAGEAQLDGERTWYVTAAGTFYVNPDFAITGHVGFDRWYETADEDEMNYSRALTYGARVELGLGQTPLSVYAGYMARRETELSFDFPDEAYHLRTRTVYVGVRMLLGRDSLQEMGDAVGFADLNPIYGDQFAPR